MSNITKIKINQLKKVIKKKNIYENLSFTDINYDDDFVKTIYDKTLNIFNLILCKNIDDFVVKSISGGKNTTHQDDELNDSDTDDDDADDEAVELLEEENEEDN